MSKGKELLVHALDRLKHINFEDDHLTNDLIQTIQKYLTQPETKQATPRQGLAGAKILEVALYWMKELKYVYADHDYDYEDPYLIKDINELEELIAQGELPTDSLQLDAQEPDYYLWHNKVHEEHTTTEGGHDVYPLYTAPPKREPLSDLQIWTANSDPVFEDGVRFTEKHYGVKINE